uniref:ATP synthase F0 subunit 8 n=1 Tax=Deltocephalinae sp. EMHAU-2015-Zz052318 TaxID=2038644 RepID=A0A343K616_9HEMI|nr:ATP synthase F0 subunit 8 [Deltocephalinae sp. EMHAU-2015-Zz052318]
MPQMAPMWWTVIMTTTTTMLILSIMVTYFHLNMKIKTKFKSKFNKMTWLW